MIKNVFFDLDGTLLPLDPRETLMVGNDTNEDFGDVLKYIQKHIENT